MVVPNTATMMVMVLWSRARCGSTSLVTRRGPMHVDRENHGHIGQQRQGEPFQVAHVSERSAGRPASTRHIAPKQHRIQVRRAAQQQPQASPMAAMSAAILMVLAISSRPTSAVQDRPRENRFHVGRQSFAGDVAEARAHHLDADHQGIGEQHRPQHVVAELGAGLAVGRDAARIVIGSARDEARAQLLDPGIVRNAFQRLTTPSPPGGVTRG